jgi:SAM-dependent methyltransferase
MSDRHEGYLRQEIELHKRLARVYTEKRYKPEFSRIFQSHWNRRMIRVGGLDAGALVLDYGCGTGVLYGDLVGQGYRVVGLDLSFEMLAADNRDVAVMRVCADGTRIPTADGVFDAVFCRGSVHHLPDIRSAFEEIRRVLKPGGLLVFSEPSNDSIVNRIARKWMYLASDEFEEEDEGFLRGEIEPMLGELGFDIEYSRGFGFLAYTLAGFPDKLNILGHLPGANFLTRAMIVADNVLERLPLIHRLALHWQVRARKVPVG